MLDLFKHPEFLAIGAALIAAPIIIHLINRLRFKRFRWAAMEFLLKAQKRNRRRLIIEQLLLLALRCLLVALVGIMVMGFIGLSFDTLGTNQAMHIVLIDDTLSMQDTWKDPTTGSTRDCFKVAKEIAIDKIAEAMRKSTSKDKLVVLPLSKAVAGEEPLVFERLNDQDRFDEMKREVSALEPTVLHLSLTKGVERARLIARADPTSHATLHILSDFRRNDWGRNKEEGVALHEKVLEFSKDARAKVRLIDTVLHRGRESAVGNAPPAHDNVGIIDFHANTRVVGKNIPIVFSLSIANFSDHQADVHVSIWDDHQGKQRHEVNLKPSFPRKLSPNSVVNATFELTLDPQDIPENGSIFNPISARLVNPQRRKLDNDALAQDNVAHCVVEVRNVVPILVIDGRDRKGREPARRQDEDFGEDSGFLESALQSIQGKSFQVIFGDTLPGASGESVRALELPGLSRFPTVFLANVPRLTEKQLAGLENYVRNGGGVAFFLGPLVDVPYYNASMHRKGNGVFPVELKSFYPDASKPMVEPRPTGYPMLLLREDLFPLPEKYPIFGPWVNEDRADLLKLLADLPIKRYFKAVRRPKANVDELATLPNEGSLDDVQQRVLPIIRTTLPGFGDGDYRKYAKAFKRHRDILDLLLENASGAKPYQVAQALDDMLQDRGNEKDRDAFPDLTEFWKNSDPKVQSLRDEIISIREEARYGDPFMVAQSYGKGKVIAVMTTAGKYWNSWAGGSRGAATYSPIIWEMQNHLSTPLSETNRLVGETVEIMVGPDIYKESKDRLKIAHTFLASSDRDADARPGDGPAPDANGADGKAEEGKQPAREKKEKAKVVETELFGIDTPEGVKFVFSRNDRPGVFLARLFREDDKETILGTWPMVFNVDSKAEGALERVSGDEIKSGIVGKADKGQIVFHGASVAGDVLVPQMSNLSESPLFFLFILSVLIAEQALAVHLSFHPKGDVSQVPTPLPGPLAG